MAEKKITQGNNTFAEAEYDAMRSHAMVLYTIFKEIDNLKNPSLDILTCLGAHCKPGKFFTTAVTEEIKDLLSEIETLASKTEHREHDPLKPFREEYRRVFEALWRGLPS